MESRSDILKAQFADFLAQAEQESVPVDLNDLASSPTSGLYDLVGEVAALKAEIKNEGRQQKDTLGQFTDLLDTLQGNNHQLSQALQQQQKAQQKAVSDAEKTLLNEIVDLYDRLETSVHSLHHFVSPMMERKASKEFRDSLQEGLEITLRRTAQLLEQHTLKALLVMGKPVDPHTMRVTEVRYDPAIADGQVLEEVRRGYLHQGELFRLAEVVANRHASASTLSS